MLLERLDPGAQIVSSPSSLSVSLSISLPLSLSPVHPIMLVSFSSNLSSCWKELQAYIILTKRSPSGRGNLSSGYKHNISGISSDWMGFGYVPIPEPITEATVRIH